MRTLLITALALVMRLCASAQAVTTALPTSTETGEPASAETTRPALPPLAANSAEVRTSNSDRSEESFSFVPSHSHAAPAQKLERFHLTKTTIGFLAADAVIRAEDAYTTHLGMKAGYTEMNLPASVVNNNAAMWSFSMGVVATNAFIAYEFEKHGHRAMARVFSVVDVTLTTQQVVDNWSVLRRR